MLKTYTKVKLPWKNAQDLVKQVGLERFGRVQMTIDKAVIDYCMQYCPWKSGTLARSPYTSTVIGSGEVVYEGPYARYQYYGAVMGTNIPNIDGEIPNAPQPFFSPKGKKKHLTGEKLTYNTDYNPLAGPFWDVRMAADHLDDIIEEAKSVAGIK